MAIPGVPLRGLSRKERVALFVHRGLDRWLSPFGVWVFRRTTGRIARPFKVDALLLTTRGRRSGRARTVVLQFFPDGASMIVAAANDGGRRNPGWFHNLVAERDAVVEVNGRRLSVRAELLDRSDAEGAWRRILVRDPSYERYARAARRSIPIIRLVPIAQESEPEREEGRASG